MGPGATAPSWMEGHWGCSAVFRGCGPWGSHAVLEAWVLGVPAPSRTRGPWGYSAILGARAWGCSTVLGERGKGVGVHRHPSWCGPQGCSAVPDAKALGLQRRPDRKHILTAYHRRKHGTASNKTQFPQGHTLPKSLSPPQTFSSTVSQPTIPAQKQVTEYDKFPTTGASVGTNRSQVEDCKGKFASAPHDSCFLCGVGSEAASRLAFFSPIKRVA